MKLLREYIKTLFTEASQDDYEYVRSALDDDHAEGNVWEKIFQSIRNNKLYGAPSPNIDIDKLAMAMNKSLCYDTHRDAFEPIEYKTFEDWFLRDLAPDTLDMCTKKASLSDMSSPVQGTIRKSIPSGEMTLKKSVIMSEDLLGLLGCDELIQISLKKIDYHRVHSPVDGTISGVLEMAKDGFFPGAEAMTVISIETKFGDVKMMCIGEWSVQTFVPRIDIGDIVNKMSELGFFYFGSQVIIAFPACIEMIVDTQGKQRVFPGDPIGLYT